MFQLLQPRPGKCSTGRDDPKSRPSGGSRVTRATKGAYLRDQCRIGGDRKERLVTRTFAPALPSHAPFPASSLTLVATRAWRRARDAGRPVQPALFAALDALRCGILAPVFAGLLAAYESRSGRPIRVGGSDPASPSPDEHHLLELLEESGDGRKPNDTNSGPGGALRIALRSTRIMMRLALESAGEPRGLRSILGRRLGARALPPKPAAASEIVVRPTDLE
jgi:hypothetical protein